MTDPAEPEPNPLSLIAKALEEYDEGVHHEDSFDVLQKVRQILAEHGEGE